MPNTVGLVINPKDGQLFYAECEDNKVKVYDLDDQAYGSGYFNRGHGSYSWPSEVTHLPRVHTANALNKGDQGKGHGTVLYTSLCMTAFQSNRREIKADTGDYRGEGICSSGEQDQRSELASLWWDRAENEFGLVESTTDQIKGDFSFTATDSNTEVNEDFYDLLGKIVQNQMPADYVDVDDFSVKTQARVSSSSLPSSTCLTRLSTRT